MLGIPVADIFIGYFQDDRQRVELVATTLEAEGLSVRWDPEIKAGESFDEIIVCEITEAKCVIVFWSERSVKSKLVRSEAAEAVERQILVPVKIEKVKLLIAFRLVQTKVAIVSTQALLRSHADCFVFHVKTLQRKRVANSLTSKPNTRRL